MMHQQQPQSQQPSNNAQMNTNYMLNNAAPIVDPQLQIQQQQMSIHHQQHLIQPQRTTSADLHGQPVQIGLANGK